MKQSALAPAGVPAACRLLALLAPLLLLAACGGGSSGGSGGSTLPPGTATKHVLVDPGDEADFDELEAETGCRVVGPVDGTPYWIVEIPAGADLEEFLKELGDDTRVVDAEPDLGLDAPEGEGSTVPFLGAELPLMVRAQPELTRIGLAIAGARATGAGVAVAVLDTGVTASHPLLLGRVDLAFGRDLVDGDPDPTEERNGLDDDGDGLVDEGYGHGTFVASLILAVAPDATILPLRVLDSDSVGTASGLASAIDYAVGRGVSVINLSVGMRTESRVVQEAVKNARSRGVLVVAAAGNTGQDDVRFPAALSDGLSVTSVAPDDRKPPFASYGSDVDLCAPGTNLLGAHPDGAGTARWSGTSFSAALVSGAAALLAELDPAADPDEVGQRLRDTAVDVDGLNPAFAGRLGRGRLDVAAATGP